MQLYFNPRSRAVIAKWMLDECGAEYELVPISLEKREHKTPQFLQVNPSGKLPALHDGDVSVFENAAICLYLADKYPQARLAPPTGSPLRGRYLSLMVYSTAQLEPAMGDMLLKQEHLAQRGWTDHETAKDVVEGQVGQGPYLFGEQFTAADIMIGAMFLYQRAWGVPTGRPVLEADLDRLAARPAAMQLG